MSTQDVGKLRFQIRPSPVLADHRPLFKISPILLILEISSRSGRSSLPRLQLFSWAMRKTVRQNALIAAAESSQLAVQAWGFDPALVIALKFACAEQLIRPVSTGYEITDRGTLFIKDINKNADLLADEKLFLHRIGKKITETMVNAVVESWRNE